MLDSKEKCSRRLSEQSKNQSTLAQKKENDAYLKQIRPLTNIHEWLEGWNLLKESIAGSFKFNATQWICWNIFNDWSENRRNKWQANQNNVIDTFKRRFDI